MFTFTRPVRERDIRRGGVAKVRFTISMSLGGFTAGPEQSPEHPIGVAAPAGRPCPRRTDAE